MKQKTQEPVEQVFYEGKWIDRKHFRVCLYSVNAVKLVKSPEELDKLKASGEWFDSVTEALAMQKIAARRTRKPKEVVELVQPLDEIKEEEDFPVNDEELTPNGTDG